MTKEELEQFCHSRSIEELCEMRRLISEYISTWFCFDQKYKARRTPEWIEKAKWRLEGKTEPCCECGEQYPTNELHFEGHVFCKSCRDKGIT